MGGDLEALANVGSQVDQAAGVSPLVVVPGDNLDLVVDDLGQAGIEDGGVLVADDVGGDQRSVVGVLRDTLQLVLGGLLQSGVNGLDGDRLLSLEGQVGQGAGDNRNADCVTVQLALQLRQNQGNCLSSTCLLYTSPSPRD